MVEVYSTANMIQRKWITAPLVLSTVLVSGMKAETNEPPVLAKLILCFAAVVPNVPRVRATDDSMSPSIDDGDTVTGSSTSSPDNGALCIVRLDDNRELIRRVWIIGNQYVLVPENKQYPTLRLRSSEIKELIEITHVFHLNHTGER